mgnify:CR=1 FL=1
MPETAKYLNLGCGSRYHPAWTNIDIVARGPEVLQHDVRRGIPLPDASCAVVYHTAVLEHLRRAEALSFMRECCRVLQPGGIVRVGVPDLEQLCLLYLEKLRAAMAGDVAAAADYEWIMLELYDQVARERSGGDMLAYLRQVPLPNEAFVFARIGEEGRQIVERVRHPASPTSPPPPPSSLFTIWRRRLRRLPATLKARLLKLWLGAEGLQALEIGRFRLGGEAHQWMYDRYSLARLLMQAGFQDPQVQSAHISQIPNWTSFQLDTLPDGQIIKPDLFFMEARKP